MDTKPPQGRRRRRLLRVYFDRETTYTTVPIDSTTTAKVLQNRIAHKCRLLPDKAKDYIIVLLTRRRPQWQDTETRLASASITSEDGHAARSIATRLRRNWDGVRVLQQDQNLIATGKSCCSKS